MKFTEHYKLGSVEIGQPLLPLEDSRRFLTIDRQLLGLFEVFGNGVITGWNVTSGSGLSVNISTGRGHVNYFAAETTIARTLTELTPSTVNYVYAQTIEETRFSRNVLFFADTTLLNSGEQILLAKVTTDADGVTEIDSTVRNDISFIETIKTLINQHRHRGGDDNPSKIDLQTEVSGQLPGYRIDGLDASKIISGRIDPARIPTLEHSDLLNSGILTHAQLDSFVRSLSNPNTRLMGELASTNLLQAYLALKHIWNVIDDYTFNMLVMIPGITPDSFSDLAHTTALFDRSQHSIQGIPSLAGELLTTSWLSATDFRTNVANVNIDIKSEDTDYFQIVRPLTESIVEGFDNVFANGTTIPNWTVESIASNSNTTFKSDSSKKVDGAYSAELEVDQSMRLQTTRQFATPQDWTAFNEIEVSIDTRSASHGQIRLQILKGTGSQQTEVADFLILDTNEITSGFRNVIFDVVSVERNAITAIRIYTDTSLGWDLSNFTVNIDAIKLNNNLFFKESGSIRFRFETPQRSKWAAISWDADINDGTIQARARSAPNFALMDGTSSVTFGPYFSSSGGDPQISDNTNVEIELALTSNADKTSSPTVNSITLSFITSSTSAGLTIETTRDFLRATKMENTTVETVDVPTDDGQVVIDGRVDVGDVPYGNIRSVQQVDRFNTPVVGITGNDLPLSPIQASTTEFVLRQPSLEGVSTVIRRQDKSYLITDTLNDRVLLLDRNGNIVKGLASNNARNLSDAGLYPLTALYNRDDKILYVTWTSNVNFASLDLSAFTINGSGIVIKLSNNIDTVLKLQGRNSNLDSGNVTPILLGTLHAGQMEFFLDSQSVSDPRLYLDVEPDAVQSGLNLSSTNFATLASARGLPIAVAPITYVRGIFRPISVTVTEAENWLIGNAKPLLTTEESTDIGTGVGTEEIVSVLEMDPDTGEVVFSDNSVDFSLVTLGGAIEHSNGRYVTVAGITKDESPPTTSTTTVTTRASLGLGTVQTTSTVAQPAATTQTTEDTSGAVTTTTFISDLDMIGEYRGVVKTVEKKSGRVVFEEPTSDGTYAADVQLDQDDQFVVVEKSFDGNVGRGRVVKVDELGNVFFQFGFKDLSSPNDVRVLSTGNLVISS